MSIARETMSESNSDCTGRESSLGSREDLQDIMAVLGISSPEFVAEDRFRVDRKSLESLLFGNDPNAASKFFHDIMQETRTHIAWPSRLKLNAKSKKDPHIRILGRADDVKVAHDKVLAVLGNKGNRINMKIDVSYTEHSHIIGKGGLTIRRVMEQTACHIHFPDSNRTNPIEKSNQVSIAGEVSGVEKARARVRELTPLIFCFELPILEALTLTPDPTSPVIKNIQDIYNVQVMYRTRQKLNSTLVVVKGCEWEVDQVKEATKLLITHMCKSLADQVSVYIMLEISPHHHSIVLGKNNENLKAIMMNTKTQITFLDPTDPNIPSLKKSTVTITGSINDVYLARQQLIGSLPVVFMFDIPESSPATDTNKMSDIMNKFDVLINTRHKPKQNIVTFIIKGIERNIGNIYEAHRKLIGSTNPPVEVEIPSTYHIPNSSSIFNQSPWNNNNGSTQMICPNISSPIVMNPVMGHSEPVWPHYPHYLMAQHMPLPNLPMQPPAYYTDLGHCQFSRLSLPEFPVYSSLSSNASSLSSNCASPRTASPVMSTVSNQIDPVEDTEKLKPPPGFTRSNLSNSDLQLLKHQAINAMRQMPKAGETRIPTSVWSGYGLSQSSTQAATQNDQSNWLGGNRDSQLKQNDNLNNGTAFGGNSNFLEAISPNTVSTVVNSPMLDLSSLLISMGLEQYIRLFESEEIDLISFRMMNELDLREIGVNALGARRKMLMCISELNKRRENQIDHNRNRRSAAPGAERKHSSRSSLNDC